jgi:sortase A
VTVAEAPLRTAGEREAEALESEPAPASLEAMDGGSLGKRNISAGRMGLLGLLGLVVLLVAVAVVIYGVGPLIHNRDQRALLSTERSAIDRAVQSNRGLYAAPLSTQPPVPGAAVAILAIPAVGLQQAVVEGVGSSQTVSGPGHVPGTAGVGQPGNSAVVGRRSGYGGPFRRLTDLRHGTKIVTATTEGQSVYIVQSVRTVTLVTAAPASASSVTTTTLGRAGASAHITHHAVHAGGKTGTTVTTVKLYGPSSDNQLTLVTSASSAPWNTDRAVVVVAKMQGKPFTPTPQESRSLSQLGNSGDVSALPWLVLSLLALGATIIGAAALYRRATVRSAYLLTTAPLLAFTVLAAEAAGHLLPAWL